VFGVPQAPVAPATTGTLRAYAIVYYTGILRCIAKILLSVGLLHRLTPAVVYSARV
jgi:hypothetical protein